MSNLPPTSNLKPDALMLIQLQQPLFSHFALCALLYAVTNSQPAIRTIDE